MPVLAGGRIVAPAGLSFVEGQVRHQKARMTEAVYDVKHYDIIILIQMRESPGVSRRRGFL